MNYIGKYYKKIMIKVLWEHDLAKEVGKDLLWERLALGKIAVMN